MDRRYRKNFNTLTENEQNIINKQRVLVIGAGGLGGYVLDFLSRIGVKKIKLVDFDNFDCTNLNRQLLSNENNLGALKVLEGKKYIHSINSTVEIETFCKTFEECDFNDLFNGIDVVFDCCDSIKSKFNIEEQCQIFKIPLIYAAIGGLFGQVTCILPENPLLNKIYPNKNIIGIEKELGNLCFLVATASSIQVNLFIKLILNKEIRTDGFYYIDMEAIDIDWISLTK
nr:HesA/MoeB/ThiF family protein [uncultured Cetobacterium sp.]